MRLFPTAMYCGIAFLFCLGCHQPAAPPKPGPPPLTISFRESQIPLKGLVAGLNNPSSGVWHDYPEYARVLRVWQNHGLQLDRVPEGFQLLATSYLCYAQQ